VQKENYNKTKNTEHSYHANVSTNLQLRAKYNIKNTHMRTLRNLVKQPDIGAKSMRKRKITITPLIQNTPIIPIFPKDQ